MQLSFPGACGNIPNDATSSRCLRSASMCIRLAVSGGNCSGQTLENFHAFGSAHFESAGKFYMSGGVVSRSVKSHGDQDVLRFKRHEISPFAKGG